VGLLQHATACVCAQPAHVCTQAANPSSLFVCSGCTCVRSGSTPQRRACALRLRMGRHLQASVWGKHRRPNYSWHAPVGLLECGSIARTLSQSAGKLESALQTDSVVDDPLHAARTACWLCWPLLVHAPQHICLLLASRLMCYPAPL